MIIYLSGFRRIAKHYQHPTDKIYLLSSFVDFRTGPTFPYVYQERHMLDSGAFTAMQTPGKMAQVDWEAYTDEYITFIKKTKQKLFIELDIDKVVGLPMVERLRDKIEQAVGLPTIPVWHRSRGLDYWIDLIERYEYVAIGGLAIKDITEQEYPDLIPLLKMAKEAQCKVHGLGLTHIEWLERLPFHSVDSTSWLMAGVHGQINLFNKRKMSRRYAGKTRRAKDTEAALVYNFEQWVKFQEMAELL